MHHTQTTHNQSATMTHHDEAVNCKDKCDRGEKKWELGQDSVKMERIHFG